jgi:predicted AAA+ superfamily ATPase
MAHSRERFAAKKLGSLGKLWPVVGLIGARQTGKTTLLTHTLKIKNHVTFDSDDAREEADASISSFLEKRPPPLLIDEVQKVPKCFDAIKLRVDHKRRPGSYYLTGSTEFSQKMGIRESLTGRIGMLKLHPLVLAEAQSANRPEFKKRFHGTTSLRYKSEELIHHAIKGGMPVPMFLRAASEREAYWTQWLETTVFRDLARAYGTAYNPDVTLRILREFGAICREGELPTLNHFSIESRKLRKYLAAMEACFIIQKIPIHPQGIGSDTWTILDSGLCRHLMNTDEGEGPMLSIMRHAIGNELFANEEYLRKPFRPTYYKSAKGTPIDWIDEDEKVAYKIIFHGRGNSTQMTYAERSLAGAMKTLHLPRGFLVLPIEKADIPTKSGIGLLPWTYWS